jgi:hypothetical protein
MRMSKLCILGIVNLLISGAFGPFKCIPGFVSFHGSIRASEIYKNPENKIFHWVNTMIGNVKNAHGTDHVIRFKASATIPW